MSRQSCDRVLCTNDALVYDDDGSFLCEMHAPATEQRRY